jgi:hypothetical protein
VGGLSGSRWLLIISSRSRPKSPSSVTVDPCSRARRSDSESRRVAHPFAPLAKGADFDFSSTIFRLLRPPLPFHGFTQELVDPGLVSASLPLQALGQSSTRQ